MTTPAIRLPEKPDACELCQRTGVALTRHHLIPRSLHSKKWVRKMFDRNERISSTAWLCRPCHNHIHAEISEKDMARHYHSIERLRSVDRIAEFAHWLSSKPSGFKPQQRKRKR
ncbi:hypothetical protein [Salinibius halmophilus]|uniref:hypothetical protein n=1 Tax=Salinibius halmophilus TaxID=1853216 RepID=UPI000E667032|nr:hypothetical protein [Salinibius halmophilus]